MLSTGAVLAAVAETPLATDASADFRTTSGFDCTADDGREALPTAVQADRTQLPAASKKHFLPTRRRIDREIDKLKFAYKGEVIMGLTASYGTLSSDDTDYMIILDNINASGTVATVKPFLGYFYRDNHCLGARFGYRRLSGTLDNVDIDLGPSNDIDDLDIPYLDLQSDNYSFGIFHRSYAGLDPKGRFGLFAEFELSVSTGTTHFTYERSGALKQVYSDNMQVKLAFNPGAAVYIFPNVCARSVWAASSTPP